MCAECRVAETELSADQEQAKGIRTIRVQEDTEVRRIQRHSF